MSANLTADNIREYVMAATNLDELLERVLEAEEALRESEGGLGLDEVLDISNLPTFGREVEDTAWIFSWDDSRVLRQVTDSRGWVIEDREDNA